MFICHIQVYTVCVVKKTDSFGASQISNPLRQDKIRSQMGVDVLGSTVKPLVPLDSIQ